MNQLDGASYGYGTYEQGGTFATTSGVPSFYGATLISVDDLIGKSNLWRSQKYKVPRLTTGGVKNGIPFWLLLMQLMLCRRGKWASDREQVTPDRSPQFRTIALTTSNIEPEAWEKLQRLADQFLAEDERGRDI